MATFLEGVGAISIACTLVALVPAMALVLVARRARLTVALCYTAAAALLMWARAAGHWHVELRGAAMLIAAAVAAGAFAAAYLCSGPSSLAATGSGAAAGALAGWLWLPCAGPRLGDILNSTAGGGARPAALMLLYVAGALLPALLLALAPHALPLAGRVLNRPPAAVLGGAVGAAYAVTLAAGRYDDLVGELYRIATRA